MRATVILLLLLTLTAAGAQQPQPPQPQNPQKTGGAADDNFTLKVSTQLVIEAVTVTDKNGKAISDLTAKDFKILEDNVPQTISVFEFQEFDDTPVPPPPPAPVSDVAPKVPVASVFTQNQIQPEKPGDMRYRDHRLMALYFDLTGMPDVDQLRSYTAGEKFVDTQMRPADLMSIMVFDGGAVKVKQDFTGDHEQLKKVIETLIVGDAQGFDGTISDAAAADTGTAFGQDDSEFNIFNTDRQLSALQTAAKALGTLNEEKSLVYFASGLRLNGVDNQAQLHATINAAIRANVKIYPIDARGLVASAPLGDATMGSPGGMAMYSGAAARAGSDRFQRSQDTLYALAADTGGKAMLDNNDLSSGIFKAQEGFTDYYIIGYYTTNSNLDGKFRRVKISLKEIESKLSYREGYYAGKEFGKFTTADKERQLEDALMLGDPMTEITIAMELNYFQLNSAEYFTPLTVKIPGSELALAKRGGAEHTVIDFIGEVKDDYGTTIQNIRDKIDAKLTGATAAQLAKSPLAYDTGFTLLPGKYVVKILARDAETGRIGTYQNSFVIPNLNKELQRIPISSVVLSSQRVDSKDVLFSVKQDANVQLTNPLVSGGQTLIPSVTRVFSKSRAMYIYLQAYEREALTTQPLVAFVTFYRGQVKAFETPPLAVTQGMDPKSKAVPLRFSLPLDKLAPGEYNCQVTVLDPNGNKANFWQGTIMLIP